jgi:hypothetical protein
VHRRKREGRVAHLSPQPGDDDFLRPLLFNASRTFWSSQEFIEVRSSSGASGNTASSSGYVWPEKLSVSTVVMVVGTLKILAAFARATVLFFNVWRSMLCTPKAIWGCWSMKISWLF